MTEHSENTKPSNSTKPLSKNKIYQIINQVESQPIKFN